MVKHGKKATKGKKVRMGFSPASEARVTPFFQGYLLTSTLSAGKATVDLNPTTLGSGRLVGVADGFALYRLVKARFRLINNNTGVTAGSIQGACILPGITDTAPSNAVQVCVVPGHTILGAGSTIPSKWVTVSGAAIKGPLPWYKTVPGTPDPFDESQCSLFIVGTSSDTYAVEIQLWYEFRDPVETNSTPALVRNQQEIMRRRREIEAILAYSPTPAPAQPPITAKQCPCGH